MRLAQVGESKRRLIEKKDRWQANLPAGKVSTL
jgi:hypothetical protein